MNILMESGGTTRVSWSDVSIVPFGWKLQPCRAIVHNVEATNAGAANQNYLSLMANVGIIPYEDKGDVGNKKPEDLTKCKLVRKGDLVINSMNYAIGSYGMSDYDGVCSSVYLVLRVREEAVLSRFALRIFENRAFQKYVASLGNGILEHRAAIGWDDLKGIKILLPPRTAQKAIVDFIDERAAKLDRLILLRRRQIELLREQRAALLQQVITRGLNPRALLRDSGIPWLGEIPKHWKLTSVKREARLISKGTTPSTIGSELVESGIRYFKAENVFEGNIYPRPSFFISSQTNLALFRSQLKPYDLLVVIAGATTGKSGVLPPDLAPANLNQAVSFVRFKNAQMSYFCNEWLASSLIQEFIRQIAVQSAQPNLSMQDLGNIPIVSMGEDELNEIMREIRRIKAKFDALQEGYARQVQLLAEYRTALIHECVTGQRTVDEALRVGEVA